MKKASKKIQICLYLCILMVVSIVIPLQAELRVRDVQFSGNDFFSKRELLSVMELTPRWPFNRIRFTDFRLRSDIEILRSLYLNEGFREVYVSRTLEVDTARGTVRIEIEIQEGARTHIEEVSLKSYKGILDPSVLNDLNSVAGAPLRNSSVNRDIQKLKQILGQKGYLEVSVKADIRYDRALNLAEVTYTITEGPLIIVERIDIKGHSGLRDRVINREIVFDKGDTLIIDALRRSERRLYRTGLLSTVHIQYLLPDTTEQRYFLPDSNYAVAVNVNEADFLRVQAGVGYGTEDGFRASATSSYHNLFRLGHRISIAGALSQKKQGIESVYSFPWLYQIPLFFDTKAYFNRYNEPEIYQGVFNGLRFDLGHRTDFDLQFQTWAKWEHVRWVKAPVDVDMPSEIPTNPTQSIGLSISHDKRNDLFNPTNGTLLLLQNQLAGLFDRSSNQFLKIEFDARLYNSYRSRLFFSSALRGGWVHPYGRSLESGVPVQEKFVSGGARSVRGFKENHLAVQSSGDPFTGNFYLVANVMDFRFPLFGWFEGALFLDAGYVWRDLDEMDGINGLIDDLRWSAGPGLRINTPLMVVRTDVGFKLDKRDGERRWEIHLDLGQPF